MKSLEVLEMPQNGIRKDGIICIAAAVAANTGLRVLNLNDNTFGKTGYVDDRCPVFYD